MTARDEAALTLKALVIDQVRNTLLEEDWQWQPSLSEALEDLTAAQAAYKPSRERHSIWQIVRHLILWKRAVLLAWDGNPPEESQLGQADWATATGDEAAWQQDVRTLMTISREYLDRVQRLDDADLSRQMFWYKHPGAVQPLAIRVVRTVTHDIYHAGQIRYLRALQGI